MMVVILVMMMVNDGDDGDNDDIGGSDGGGDGGDCDGEDDQVNVEMVMKLVEIVRGRIDFSYYQNWSTRGDQRLQSSGYLQMLQRLTEISEFIDFMNSSSKS